MSEMELLAPAGNTECLYAAAENGADAVYFAGKLFGARSYAENFSDDEIKSAVRYCHLRGVKVYITVNTLVSDREIPEAMEYLKFLNNIGVDAVIVQDLGLAMLIRENFPFLPIHGSTQITVHNTEGVLALEKMGMEQVVLSRELSLKEIEKISKETSAKLEIFAHGALCMCYSGQCYLSSVLGGRSGNRGKCAQPCRLEYKINDYPEKEFYMSLKDLCSLNHINEMRKIGISSLKIEGRMKGKEYVAAVVRIYRKYMDSGDVPTKEDAEILNRIFFRGGLTDGYLINKTGRDMFCFSKPDNPYEKQDKGGIVLPKFCRKKKLYCSAVIKEGSLPEIEISDGEISVLQRGDETVQTGETKILEEEFVREKLGKTGGTPYEFEKIDITLEGRPFMSAGQINKLRRDIIQKYEDKITASYERNGRYVLAEDTDGNKDESFTPEGVIHKKCKKAVFTCRVANLRQFEAVKEMAFENIYAPARTILENREKFLNYRDKIVIETPAIVKNTETIKAQLEKLKNLGFSNLAVNNIGFSDFEGFNLFGGFRLNVFNSRSLKFLKEKGFLSAMLSPELNLAQIKDLEKPIETEVMVYGRLPLMVTENCIIRNREKCGCNREVNFLTDRKGMKFPVMRDGGGCRSVVLNSLPTFMGDKLKDVRQSGACRLLLYFTVEDSAETEKVCEMFFSGKDMPEKYTRLHYYKGVL